MNINWIIERLKHFNNHEAMIYDDRIYTFSDILSQYEKEKKFLAVNQIKESEIIAVEGFFSIQYFSLLLALIDNKNIILPLLPHDDYNNKDYLDISEADKKITIHGDRYEIENIGGQNKNALLKNFQLKKLTGLILFSSGSTGKPKGILHHFMKLLDKYREKKHALKTMLFLQANHIGGINTIFYTLLNGGTLVITKTKKAEDICAAIEKYKIELLPATPSFLNILLISELYQVYDLSSLKLISYGTEVMQENILKSISKLLPDVKFRQTYGLSELGILRVRSKSSDSVLVQLDHDQFETKIVDNILYIKSDSAMEGYLNDEDPFDEEGWFNTQDKVAIENNYIKILGRASEMINIGGEKIYPSQIEDIIIQMPGIKDVVIRGEKNPIMGNIITAKVNLLKDEETFSLKKRIRAFCKGKIKDQMIPVKIQVVQEELFNARFKKVRNF